MVRAETVISVEELNGEDTRTRHPKPELIVKSHWTENGKCVLEFAGNIVVVDSSELRIAIRNAEGLSL